MALNPNQLNTLNQASRSAICNIIPKLKIYWSTKSWLSVSNPYKKNSIKKIDKDHYTGKISNHKQLSEYVAASAIVHCFDGWSYLGKALEAEMVGDPDTARHLGYYAELRAAMSILAGDGIGVFNNRHIIVTANQKCVLLNYGTTHTFAWEALKAWANSPGRHNTLFQVIRPGGLPLQEWLNQFNASAHFIANTWLQQWGLDLSRLTQDREARNLASYRPIGFTSSGPRPIGDTMEAILRFWEICEPGPGGGFPVLDLHLLRRSLELVSKKIGYGRSIKNNYEKQLNMMLNALNLKGLSPDQFKKFLEYSNLQNIHQILQYADARKNSYHPDHSKQVLARATLLLRVATGSSADLLDSAGLNLRGDLEFWWSSAAVRRCLWPKDNEPSSFIDLWQDVYDAIGAVDQWPQDYYTLWSKHAREAATLATIERAFLWGLGL